ncbi:MAG: hypothetical protein ACRBBW_15330 [Cellvibrionaceae bacterium]
MVAIEALGMVAVKTDDNLNVAAPTWEQMLQSRPCLNHSILSHCHHYRGIPWVIFENRFVGTFYRLDPLLTMVFDGADGDLTLQQRLTRLPENHKEALSAEQVIATYLALLKAQIIVDSAGQIPASNITDSNIQNSAKPLWLEAITKPFAVRVPLLLPDKWLGSVYRYARAIFNGPAAILSLVAVVWAVLKVPLMWSELSEYFDAQFIGVTNGFLLLLIYPAIKFIHEVAHGLAIKHWGGRVKEAGLMFLVFIPIPYVDASASSAFGSKWQRMAVSGAGIWAELLLSTLALWVWLIVPAELVKLIAFDVMVLAAGSTLLFNANPLLRFDGYYLLVDAIGIPNLSTRSNRYLSYLIRRYCFGLDVIAAPMNDPHERSWLVAYGVLAYLYRLGLSIIIALYLSSRFFVLGLFFAAWLLAIQVFRPLISWSTETWRLSSSSERKQVLWRTTGTVSVLALLLLTPLPSFTIVKGLVQAPEHSLIRANQAGIASAIEISTGHQASAGQVLVRMSNPDIAAAVAKLKASLREAELRQAQALDNDLSQMARYAERSVGLREQLEDAELRLKQLSVKSPAEGTFVSLDLRDLNGRWLEQGQLIGYLNDGAPLSAVAVVNDSDARRLRLGVEGIEVLQHPSNKPIDGRLILMTPAANYQLPSALLGSMGGGNISVDARDSTGRTSMAPTFKLEVQLLGEQADSAIKVGSAVNLRFKHKSRSLAGRSGEFLKRFWLEKVRI